MSNSGENWGWDADDWLCWDVITEVGDNVRKLCLTLLMVKWTIGKLTSPGVSLSTINRSYTMLKLFLFFTPYKGKVWSSFHTPLERYLSRKPTPKYCDVWCKFATVWTLNYPSYIFNYLLRKFETDAMLINDAPYKESISKLKLKSIHWSKNVQQLQFPFNLSVISYSFNSMLFEPTNVKKLCGGGLLPP